MIGCDDLTALASAYETPLFVYDGHTIARTCARLREYLTDDVELLYSVKANPNSDVCRFVFRQGLGAEVASSGELAVALRTGAPPSKTVAAGPAKTDDELRGYVASGIGFINVESEGELTRLDRVARAAGRRVDVALRVNPRHGDSGAKVRMTGKPSAFGIDEELLWDRLDGFPDLEGVAVCGLSVYFGTAILSADKIIENSRYIAGLARRLAERLARPLEAVNFGGGFGLPFAEGEAPLDLERAARGIARICAELRASDPFRATRFLVESGRYIVGAAGRFVCRVHEVKMSRGREFVIVDGGIHHYMGLSPHWHFDRKPPAVRVVPSPGRVPGPETTADIVGPLCTTLDCLARGVRMPRPEAGDLIVFENSGAYALSMSPLLFLSRETPAEVFAAPSGELAVRPKRKTVGMFDELAVTRPQPRAGTTP
jgi:diaminopimelate decarboxylase